jgi:demethylmacrocin O-methyltransferase
MKTPRDWLRNRLPPVARKRIRNTINDLKAIGYGRNLSALARIYGTDKWGSHFYTPHYETHFRRLKYKRIKLIEIGVGGFGNPMAGATSLRMWKRYFPFGRIYSLDIYDKSYLQEKRIQIFRGSQVDKEFLFGMIRETGAPDIIVDDGSHLNEHVIETFRILFPLLKDGGIYVVEDTQTSYWPDYGGSSDDLKNANTLMNFFKAFVDGLNHAEFIRPRLEPDYYEENILSIHFYHNLIFVYKGRNDEPSYNKPCV